MQNSRKGRARTTEDEPTGREGEGKQISKLMRLEEILAINENVLEIDYLRDMNILITKIS